MRQKALFALIIVGSALLLLFRLAPAATVEADVLLQDVPRLDGYQIYFAETNGEASRFDRSTEGLSRLAGLLQRLGAQLTTLEWNKDIPLEVDLVIIAGPVTDLSAEQSARLWSYVNNQGRLLLLVDPLTYRDEDGVREFLTNRALGAEQGFFILTWDDLGVRARNDLLVIPGELQTIFLPADEVEEGEPTPTPIPPVEAPALNPIFTTDAIQADHPVTAGITDPLAFFGARSLEFDASIQLFDAAPLVFTGDQTYGEVEYGFSLETGYSEYNIGVDIPFGPSAVIAAVEDTQTQTRIVVVGDRDFATNGGGFQTSPSYSAGFVFPGNVRLTLNAIAWLLEADPETAVELTFPTPGPTATMTITPSPAPTQTPEAVTDEG